MSATTSSESAALDLFSEVDFPNTTSASDEKFEFKVTQDQQLLQARMDSANLTVNTLSENETCLQKDKLALKNKCEELKTDISNIEHTLDTLKAQIATSTTNDDVQLLRAQIDRATRRQNNAEEELESVENDKYAASKRKRCITAQIASLATSLKMLNWLQGASWKHKPSLFTQTPEWDCLGRSQVEHDIISTIGDGMVIDPTNAASSIERSNTMVQIVSAPRQGKSLMLDRLSRHYLQNGWAVVAVTFNGPRTHKMPPCPPGVSQDQHAIRELWSRVLAAAFDTTAKAGYGLEVCRQHVRNAHATTGGGGIGRLLGSALGGKPVLLLIDEISVLTDNFQNMSSTFAEYLMTFLSPQHKVVYTTFDGKMNDLFCRDVPGCAPIASFELPLIETKQQMWQLLPQKVALHTFCKKEGLPFMFLYNMLKSSPGTLGAVLDPAATTIPIFDLLASPSSNHLWGECIRPYIEYSVVGKVTSKELLTTEDELFKLILDNKLGIDGGRKIIPVFLAMFVLSRNVDCFIDDDVWTCLHHVLVTFRTDCGKMGVQSTSNNTTTKALGILVDNYIGGSLLLKRACSGTPSRSVVVDEVCNSDIVSSSSSSSNITDDCCSTHTTIPIDVDSNIEAYANLLSPVLAHFVPDVEITESGSWQAIHRLCDVPVYLSTPEARIQWLADVTSAIGNSVSNEDLLAEYNFDVQKEETMFRIKQEGQHVMWVRHACELSECEAIDYKTTLAKCVVARAFAAQSNIGIQKRIGRLLQHN